MGNEHPEQGSGSTQPDLPMRTLACLLLGAAMVGLYHLLPRTRQGRPFRAALLVLGGFILAQGGLSAAIVGLGLVPKRGWKWATSQSSLFNASEKVEGEKEQGYLTTRYPKHGNSPRGYCTSGTSFIPRSIFVSRIESWRPSGIFVALL